MADKITSIKINGHPFNAHGDKSVEIQKMRVCGTGHGDATIVVIYIDAEQCGSYDQFQEFYTPFIAQPTSWGELVERADNDDLLEGDVIDAEFCHVEVEERVGPEIEYKYSGYALVQMVGTLYQIIYTH